jgi:hypothetical protein
MNQDKNGLICRADKLVFPIDDGIPVMLESQAQTLHNETADKPSPVAS